MKKAFTVFAILSILLLFASDSFAQPNQGMIRGRASMKRSPSRILFVLKAHKDELKITDDQLKQIEDMVFSFEEQCIVMRSKASTNRLEMRKLMADRENLEYDQIRAAFTKTADHRADMVIARMKFHEEVNTVLTSEQQDALKSMREDRFKDRGDFRGRRGFQRHPCFREGYQEK